MRPIKLLGPIVLAAVVAGMTQSVPPRPLTDLRVCADPYNMPFSNDREEGFENKIAHVVAQDLNATVINYWWPERRGFLRNSILAGFCDVLINVPVGFDPVATTKAYYRSTYYFVYRTDRGLNLHSLDDTLLKHLKIGVNMIGYDYTNTPPAHALGSRGVVGLVGFGNFLNPDPKADHPQDIVDAVAKDSIDVAIVWGPKAGYWVKREAVPLTMVPLPDSDAVSGMPFAFDMAMGVRHRDKALKAQLDSVIDRRRGEIHILDIALVPERRGEGIGTALLKQLLVEAEESGKVVILYVEQFNPAQGLYRRLGFQPVKDEGVYWMMQWSSGRSGLAEPLASGEAGDSSR